MADEKAPLGQNDIDNLLKQVQSGSAPPAAGARLPKPALHPRPVLRQPRKIPPRPAIKRWRKTTSNFCSIRPSKRWLRLTPPLRASCQMA